jgi:hypothetical protein
MPSDIRFPNYGLLETMGERAQMKEIVGNSASAGAWG